MSGLLASAVDKVEDGLEAVGLDAVDLDGDRDGLSAKSGDGSIKSICFWMCAAPCCMLLAVMLIGWNEKRAVCDAKALDAGLAAAKDAGCTSNSDTHGKLVFMNCELDAGTSSVAADASSLFSGVSHTGHCLTTTGKMYQCKETCTSTEQTDADGKKTTVKTCSHAKSWETAYINSGSFDKTAASFTSNCGGADNPTWPSQVPQGISTTYATSATAGTGTWPLTGDQLKLTGINCNAVEAATLPVVSSYTKMVGGLYESSTPIQTAIGATKVTLKGDNSATTTWIVGVGKNNNGKIEPWTAPDDWLCSGSQVYSFATGQTTKEEYFKNAKDAAHGATWIMRIIFFCLLWGAWYCLGKPWVDMLDGIPLIGDWLEDKVEAILPFVTFPPACACCFFVAAVMWIIMRPVLAIFMLLLCCCCCAMFGGVAFIAITGKGKKPKKQKEAKEEENAAEPEPAQAPIPVETPGNQAVESE